MLGIAGLLLVQSGPVLQDVPANYWARAAVVRAVQSGIMPATGNKFRGGASVSRLELIGILAKLGHMLETHAWHVTAAAGAIAETDGSAPLTKPISRYLTAVVIVRIADLAVTHMDSDPGSPHYESEVLTPLPANPLKPGAPGYDSLAFLIKHRMLRSPSSLLHPGPTPITGADLGDALAMLITGLNDRNTHEVDTGLPAPRTFEGAAPAKH